MTASRRASAARRSARCFVRFDMREEMIRRAQEGFAEAQKCAGTADIVARVRRMPNGALDVVWNRRVATEQRLRLGSIGGLHPQLARIAAELRKPAPKGHFYVITIALADDSDAALSVAPKAVAAA